MLNGEWTERPALAMLLLGVANVLTATAAGRMGATKASATPFLIPVVTLVLGVAVGHEHMTTISVTGAGTCLLGAAIIRDPLIL